MLAKIGGGRIERVVLVHGKTPAFVDARMMVFGARLGVVGQPRQLAGMIIVPRWVEKKRGSDESSQFRSRRERIFTLVPTVYDAFRQCWHMLYGYGIDMSTGEKAKLDEAARALRAFNLAVLDCEQRGDLEALRAATETLVARASFLLGSPVSTTKQAAVLQLLALGKGFDSRGRRNPSALMARATAAHALVQERLEREVLSIDPHIQARQQVLVAMIQIVELRLAAVDHLVRTVLRRSVSRWSGTPAHRAMLAQQCAWYAQDLSLIDYNPYCVPCADLVEQLTEATRLLRAFRNSRENLHALRAIFVRCSHTLRILAAMKELERINFRLLRYEHCKGPFPEATIRRMYRNVRTLLFHPDGSVQTGSCPALAAGHIEALEPILTAHRVSLQSEEVKMVRDRCKKAVAALYTKPAS